MYPFSYLEVKDEIYLSSFLLGTSATTTLRTEENMNECVK